MCVFCSIVEGKIPAYVVLDRDHVLAFLDINPVARGHTLVITKRHYESLLDVPKEELSELFEAAKAIGKALLAYGYEGVNFLSNAGKAAGQEIMHVHIHVIPRRQNDGLFKRPQTRRASKEELEATAKALRELL